MSVRQNLEKMLSIPPEPIGESPLVAGVSGGNFEQDFEYVRSNLQAIIAQGGDLLVHALAIAKSSQSPRHFEVATMLLKALSEVNVDVLNIHEKAKGLDLTKKPDVTNNNLVFLGTSADFLNHMRPERSTDKENQPKILEAQVIPESEKEPIDGDL